jgi:hypothetical protein
MLQTKKFRRNGLSVTVNIRVKTSSVGAAPPGEPLGNYARKSRFKNLTSLFASRVYLRAPPVVVKNGSALVSFLPR